MSINSAGANISVDGRGVTATPVSVVITDLSEPGRECITACLNGGGWRRHNASFSSTDDSVYADARWVPIYVDGEDGQKEFIGCNCPALNSSYTPNVSVSFTGNPGQIYNVRASRTSFDPPGGEIIDTGSGTPGYVNGVIGDEGQVSLEFTFILLHEETDGTLPPPVFSVAVEIGPEKPAIEAGIMARQEVFAECFAACSRESGGVKLPWLNGCRVDLRDSVVAAASTYGNLPIKVFPREKLSVTLRNLVSPSTQDVVVIKLALPNMQAKLSLMPILAPRSMVTYDERLSVFLVSHFSNTNELLATPKIERVSHWSAVKTPNTALLNYFGNESRLVIMKDKWPGRSTDYNQDVFEGSCDLSGEWFLSLVGDSSSTELKIDSELL